MKGISKYLALVLLAVSLLAVPSAQAEGQVTTFTFDVRQDDCRASQQVVAVSYCRNTKTGSPVQATIMIPQGIVLPGTCEGTGCTYNSGFAQNPPGVECGYLYGYPLWEGYFTFRVEFYEPSTGQRINLTCVTYLRPVGNPRVTSVTPLGALPGQEITIFGTDFLPVCGAVSDLRVWLVDISTGGVSSLNYYQVKSWGERAIKLDLPANLWQGRTYEVIVLRGSRNSVAPQFRYVVGSRSTHYFFPLVLR